jgi:hypothetical protein
MLKNITWQHRNYIIPLIPKKDTAIFLREEARIIYIGINEKAEAIEHIGSADSRDYC